MISFEKAFEEGEGFSIYPKGHSAVAGKIHSLRVDHKTALGGG